MADIEADTTNEVIAELAKEFEAEANSHGFTLDSCLEDFMVERREELRDERENKTELLPPPLAHMRVSAAAKGRRVRKQGRWSAVHKLGN
jgi:hypothetical protein